MTETPTFYPRNGSPTINVHVRTLESEEDQKKEMERMWNEHAEETAKAEARAAETGEDGPLYGLQKYSMGTTVYEYDVVECEDFVEDQGCWVRNMPEEIKKKNPDFVPT